MVNKKRPLPFKKELYRNVTRKYPQFAREMVGYDKAGMASGVVLVKMKELITLAISMEKQWVYDKLMHKATVDPSCQYFGKKELQP